MMISIIIQAYNEELNIGNLLDRILSQDLKDYEIIIYNDASTDNTSKIVKGASLKHNEIKLFEGEKRKGKIHGINLCLKKCRGEIIIMQSADSFPDEGAYKRMLNSFKDETVGISASRIVPLNKGRKQMEKMAKLVYSLHDEISRIEPKYGEMIAFRNVVKSIPTDTICDEEMIAHEIYEIGLKGVYSRKSIVYNMAPQTFNDYIKQRRRLECGHILLRRKYRYEASTIKKSLIISALRKVRFDLSTILLGAIIKITSSSLGYYDYFMNKKRHVKWDIVESVKKIGYN